MSVPAKAAAHISTTAASDQASSPVAQPADQMRTVRPGEAGAENLGQDPVLEEVIEPGLRKNWVTFVLSAARRRRTSSGSAPRILA